MRNGVAQALLLGLAIFTSEFAIVAQVQVRLCIDDLVAHITNIEEKIVEYDRVLSRVAEKIIAAKNARLCRASLHYGDDFRLYSTT